MLQRTCFPREENNSRSPSGGWLKADARKNGGQSMTKVRLPPRDICACASRRFRHSIHMQPAWAGVLDDFVVGTEEMTCCVPVHKATKQPFSQKPPPTSHSVVSPFDWYCVDPRSAMVVFLGSAKAAFVNAQRQTSTTPSLAPYWVPFTLRTARCDQHAPLVGNPFFRGQGIQRRFFQEST